MFRIAIDQDTVLANLTKKWLSVYNQENNCNLSTEDITEWDMSKFCGKSIYDIIKRPMFFRDLEPVEGSQEGVKRLLDIGFDVAIVTASEPFACEDKHHWIEEHFPFVRNIIFTKNKDWVLADYLIDDGIHNLEVFRGTPILFDAPWNRQVDRFIRVSNWNEITVLFENIKRLNRK